MSSLIKTKRFIREHVYTNERGWRTRRSQLSATGVGSLLAICCLCVTAMITEPSVMSVSILAALFVLSSNGAGIALAIPVEQ